MKNFLLPLIIIALLAGSGEAFAAYRKRPVYKWSYPRGSLYNEVRRSASSSGTRYNRTGNFGRWVHGNTGNRGRNKNGRYCNCATPSVSVTNSSMASSASAHRLY